MIIFLRQSNYNDIIVLDGKKRSFFISLFLKGRKSILLQSKNLELFSKIFNYKIVNNYELQHQFKNISYLASILGFNINHSEIDVYENYKFNNSIQISDKYVVIHLDEKWYTKYYYNDFTDINPNKEQLKNFINKIFYNLKGKYNLVLTTGSKQLDILNDYTKDFEKSSDNKSFKKKIEDKYIFYFNNNSFNDLELIIKNCSFLICCEGGISHAAHNFKIKTLAFFQKNRLQHTKFWTGHMKDLILYERKDMDYIINDDNFFNLMRKNL
jgi:ADP-heptose:LPS heptosyltransferase